LERSNQGARGGGGKVSAAVIGGKRDGLSMRAEGKPTWIKKRKRGKKRKKVVVLLGGKKRTSLRWEKGTISWGKGRASQKKGALLEI